jgi:hypothetical protein
VNPKKPVSSLLSNSLGWGILADMGVSTQRAKTPRARKASVRRKSVPSPKPDMKAFARRCSVFQQEQFGERIIPDSTPLLEELREERL